MSDIGFSAGAVAALAPAAPAPTALAPAQALAAPSHCGVPMEWTAPAAATMSVYSFASTEAAAELPPVWRCGCGFQLDGMVHAAELLTELSR